MAIGFVHAGNDVNDPAALYVRVYYDANFVPSGTQTNDDAPLINNANSSLGPTGLCLVVVNKTGVTQRKVTVGGVLGVTQVNIPAGRASDGVVTTGQAQSRTVAQLAALGITKRGQVQALSIE